MLPQNFLRVVTALFGYAVHDLLHCCVWMLNKPRYPAAVDCLVPLLRPYAAYTGAWKVLGRSCRCTIG